MNEYSTKALELFESQKYEELLFNRENLLAQLSTQLNEGQAKY